MPRDIFLLLPKNSELHKEVDTLQYNTNVHVVTDNRFIITTCDYSHVNTIPTVGSYIVTLLDYDKINIQIIKSVKYDLNVNGVRTTVCDTYEDVNSYIDKLSTYVTCTPTDILISSMISEVKYYEYTTVNANISLKRSLESAFKGGNFIIENFMGAAIIGIILLPIFWLLSQYIDSPLLQRNNIQLLFTLSYAFITLYRGREMFNFKLDS